jgi:hypothetical protein
MYVLSVQYSCAVVSNFLFGGKAYLVRFTLFYSTLLTLTDRQTDRWRNELILDGLGNQTRLVPPCLSWLCWPHPDGFLQVKKKFKSSVWRVVLLCQFLFLVGNRQFFCCGGKVLLRPEKKVQVICLAGCAVVSVIGSGGK